LAVVVLVAVGTVVSEAVGLAVVEQEGIGENTV
jgi:hypothetical protein